MKPNVAIVKIIRAILDDSDGLGFTGPFCVVTHRLPDLEKTFQTKFHEDSATPEWNEVYSFVIRL